MQHRVLVCGGREYRDHVHAYFVLDHYHAEAGGFAVVIHGCARGADNMAGEWATTRFVPVEEYPADWDRNGRRAGPIRNAWMLEVGRPTLVIAFPGGRGTADMIAQAKRACVPVLEIPA